MKTSWLQLLKNKLKIEYFALVRKIYRNRLRKLFSPEDCIISNNCLGSRISQDLGYRYNSPFVGLFIKYPDYILLIQSLEKIKNAEISVFQGKGYPIGEISLGDNKIFIHFLHYHSVAEAKEKWDKRVARMDLSKAIIIGMESDNCTLKDIESFLNLTTRKVFLAKKGYDIHNRSLQVVSCMNSKHYTNGYELAHKFYPAIIQALH